MRNRVAATTAALHAVDPDRDGDRLHAAAHPRARSRSGSGASRSSPSRRFSRSCSADANPKNSGQGELTARQLIERAPDRIESQLSNEPDIQAQLYALTGRLFRDLGDEVSSEEWLDKAVSLARDLGADAESARLDAELSLARLRVDQRHEEEAIESLDRIELEIDARDPEAPALLARLIATRGRALASLGRYGEAVDEYERAVPLLDQLEANQWLRITIDTGHATALRLSREDPDRAIEMITANLAEARRLYGDDHPRLIPLCTISLHPTVREVLGSVPKTSKPASAT